MTDRRTAVTVVKAVAALLFAWFMFIFSADGTARDEWEGKAGAVGIGTVVVVYAGLYVLFRRRRIPASSAGGSAQERSGRPTSP